MTTQSKFELPQGTLDLLILRVVALGPIHGYAIAQRIQTISKEALQIQQGSLYPALHRLENKNFLVAEWGSTETGREAGPIFQFRLRNDATRRDSQKIRGSEIFRR